MICPRCPVSVHLKCSGVHRSRDFLCCSHHRCSECGKNNAAAGGLLFACESCPNAYCEDCLPADSTLLGASERFEKLGFTTHMAVYIHCSKICENVARTEFGYTKADRKKAPCPPSLDVSEHFGAKTEEALDANLEETATRLRPRRKKVAPPPPSPPDACATGYLGLADDDSPWKEDTIGPNKPVPIAATARNPQCVKSSKPSAPTIGQFRPKVNPTVTSQTAGASRHPSFSQQTKATVIPTKKPAPMAAAVHEFRVAPASQAAGTSRPPFVQHTNTVQNSTNVVDLTDDSPVKSARPVIPGTTGTYGYI